MICTTLARTAGGLLFVSWTCTGQTSPLETKCTELTRLDAQKLPNRTTVIRTAAYKPASAAQGNTPAPPAHCEAQGVMNERTGANGQRYAIKFHLRLPAAWNGRFFFEGGGGSNGNLGNA